MELTKTIRWACVALIFTGSFSVQANSIGFANEEFIPGDQVSLTINYDFTDFAMFGGGANIVYDSSFLEFVSYTQAELPFDAQAPASPIGALDSPGLYAGFGIGTFEFFNGMNSAGEIGTFVFNIIGTLGDFTGCGGPGPGTNGAICVTPNSINPFVSLAGDEVNVDLFTGPGAYIPPPHPMPVPAAFWLLLSAVGVMVGVRKKH